MFGYFVGMVVIFIIFGTLSYVFATADAPKITVAELDPAGKIPEDQLPSTVLEYKGSGIVAGYPMGVSGELPVSNGFPGSEEKDGELLISNFSHCLFCGGKCIYSTFPTSDGAEEDLGPFSLEEEKADDDFVAAFVANRPKKAPKKPVKKTKKPVKKSKKSPKKK